MSDSEKPGQSHSTAVAKLPATAKELIAGHESLSAQELLWALKRLPEHEKDLLVPCPNKMCLATEGEECKGINRRDRRKMKALQAAREAEARVHIGRRVRRLLKGIR